MNSWHSYPSIYNLGHRAVRTLLDVPVIVEEKVDGSQFSFGWVKLEEPPPGTPFTHVDGVYDLCVRSKGAVMNIDAPEKMFQKAVDTVKALAPLLQLGWTYRAEYLAKPKHNTLAYDRIPNKHIILFDVSTGDNEWLGPREKAAEAARLGLECVPVLNYDAQHGFVQPTLENLRHILDNTQSRLGGQLIEGVVIKPLVELYGPDKKTLMGKFVSERFKEAHKQAWKETSPNSGDILDRLVKTYCVEPRWMKAIQHLREAGQLTDSPKDIGILLIEIQKDLGKEEKEEIQKVLWKWAWPHVMRGVTVGFPEFYKNELLRRQFEQEGDTASPADVAFFTTNVVVEEDTPSCGGDEVGTLVATDSQ